MSKDDVLIDLMNVPSKAMKDIREQFFEDKITTDVVEKAIPRLSMYENPSTFSTNPLMERSWIEIDIYVPREMDLRDRRTLKIAQRIIDILDYDKRLKRGLEPKVVGMGLHYRSRLPDLLSDAREWRKYGLVFYYDQLI